MDIGYALICEEHGPRDLVDHAVRAVENGFAYLSISDHYHPWLDVQGESPFAWTVLGALADRVEVPLGHRPRACRRSHRLEADGA
ncbi:MAG: hypothetical protein R3343_00020 [Nitriliruptorales bacterium]|nr:hypothetical protein [Nitriliruptorales bacterium]